MTFSELFPDGSALIGVVHLLPLPGSPGWAGDWTAVERRAVVEAQTLADSGANGVIVENFGDAPFHANRVEPVTIATMSAIVRAVRQSVATQVRVGVNVLRNDAVAALSIAAVTGGAFIRVNVHTGAMVTDQGIIEGEAARTLRERARLGADVAVFADVWVKHAVPLGSGGSLERAAEDTFRRALADALIVTGDGTGLLTSLDDVARVRNAVPEAPVIVGSGVDEMNVAQVLANANGVIVGTSLKARRDVRCPVDADRARRFFSEARRATVDRPADEEQPS